MLILEKAQHLRYDNKGVKSVKHNQVPLSKPLCIYMAANTIVTHGPFTLTIDVFAFMSSKFEGNFTK